MSTKPHHEMLPRFEQDKQEALDAHRRHEALVDPRHVKVHPVRNAPTPKGEQAPRDDEHDG